MTLLMVFNYEDPEVWLRRLPELVPGIEVRVWPRLGSPEDITMMAADDVVPDGVLPRLTNLKCIQYLGHGVADVLEHPEFPAAVAVSRLADPGIIRCMTEYALTYILRHRRYVATYERQQRAAQWVRHPIPEAHETRVGVLGLGSIGAHIARTLAGLGFRVSGWARGPHAIEGVDCHHGPDALKPMLAELDYVVCVLPGTAATQGMLDADMFEAMKPGAYLINMGRGSLIDKDAITEALDKGRLAGAALDVFETEPLPPDSPLWHHAKVTITPHVAGGATTTSIATTAENYRRIGTGEPLLNIVDPDRGY